jgi:hypothetical protein
VPRPYKLDKSSNGISIWNRLASALSQSKKITVSKSGVPVIAIALLAAIFVFGLFFVGYDQGHIFSIVLGEQAFADLYIHELTHDMRHAAGFPCH